MISGKISIVIPTYNQSKYLGACLKSVFSQTRKADEVIVVDDHSTDKTEGLVSKYKDKITYIKNPANMGIVNTFNIGLKKAKNEFILMVSGDDILMPTILEQESKILEDNPRIGMVFAQSYTQKNNKKHLVVHKVAGDKSYIGRSKDFERLINEGDFIAYMTAMVRKSVYKKVGYFDPNFDFLHDWELYIRIAKKYPLAYVAKPLAVYRVHETNFHKKRSNKLYFTEYLEILKKNLDPNSKTAKLAYSSYYQKIAAFNFLEKDFKTGIINLIKSIKNYPKSAMKLKTLLTFAMILKKSPKIISRNDQLKIVLGCGPLPMHPMHYKWIDDTWTFTDLFPRNKRIIKLDARNTKYKTGSVDAIYASHILEHISHAETQSTLMHWYKVLKPHGKLIINVPDLEWVFQQFLRNYRKNQPIKSSAYKSYEDLLLVIYGHQNASGETHQTGFTQKSLEKSLKKAGFSKIRVEKSFDAHQIGVLIATVTK